MYLPTKEAQGAPIVSGEHEILDGVKRYDVMLCIVEADTL